MATRIGTSLVAFVAATTCASYSYGFLDMKTVRTTSGIPLLIRGSRPKSSPSAVIGLVTTSAGPASAPGRWIPLVEMRERIRRWKATAAFDLGELDVFACALAELVKAWSPVIPARTVATCPPQGASVPGPYAAEALARSVADRLEVPFVVMLERTDTKKYHGPMFALRQKPFRCDVPSPAPEIVLVVDDFITSGSTMRLSLAAIRGAGVPSFGFAYSGHGRGNKHE